MRERCVKLDKFTVSEKDYRARTATPNHVHADATLFITLEGSFVEVIEGAPTSFRPGTALLMPPGVVHREQFHDSEVKGLCIDFDPRTLIGLRERFGPDRRLAPIAFDSSLSLSRRLYTEFSLGDAISRFALEGLILELIARAFQGARTEPPDECWTKALRFLDQNYRKPISAADVARELGADAIEVSRGFRQIHGRSIAKYILGCRIRHAAESLVATDAQLSEIAIESGFFDQSHFSREFKRMLGVSPLRYRKTANCVVFHELDGRVPEDGSAPGT